VKLFYKNINNDLSVNIFKIKDRRYDNINVKFLFIYNSGTTYSMDNKF